MNKLLVLIAFLAAQFIITWYGYFMGKIPPQGSFLGTTYDSAFVSLLITQIRFIWVPILINIIYGLGFQLGNSSFNNFLIVISLWIASGPIAAILFNIIFVKEKLDLLIVLGIILITLGSLMVVAHKEVSKLLS
ncbi:hypothetical protein KKG16_05190 [Patescibacteria group bacterium]|nr:hypothetical protein [Patescibacteria group bacterium]